MKRSLLFVFSLILTVAMFAQGLEDFTNSNATSSYSTNSFVGNDGITWSYVASRDGNNDANGSSISLPALMLRRSDEPSSITSSSISGGIGNFSVKLYKGFTGSGNRQVELFVNGESKGQSVAFDDFNEHVFTIDNINVSGNIVIEIRNITPKQVIIDDITWTGYTSSNPMVETPVISPSGGYFSSTQSVSITSATDGASIYYTLDGTTPDEASTLYSVAFDVSATTTVKAKAFKAGYDASGVATEEYVFPEQVSDIAALRAKLGVGGTYQLTGEAIITFMQSSRNQKVIQDATGGVLIDDNAGVITSSYAQYDGITGLIGTLATYGELIQFVPSLDPGAPSSNNNVVTPELVDIPTILANWDMYESKLIKIETLTFADADGSATFANGTNYAVTDANTNAFVVRTGFRDIDLIGTVIPATAHVTGVAQRYNTTYQMFPRSAADVDDNTTAIGDVEVAKVQVSPNPFTSELNFDSNDVQKVTFYNAVGQLVIEVPVNGTSVSTTDLAKGMYILQVQFNDGSVSIQKVIKK